MESKIDTKVTLYNADNQRIGETFTRRARQLVKQQRALWTDESHTAIRFQPDTEEWETDDLAKPDSIPTHSAPSTENTLYTLAKKRIATRRRMFWHTLILIPGFVLIALMGEAMFRYSFAQGFFYGSAFTVYAVLFIQTVYLFVKHNRGFFPFAEMENRQARRLADEVERLKRMGYGK
jgi:hypothetical protein